jgi:phage/plasmid-like protein (TIGR03299 family)
MAHEISHASGRAEIAYAGDTPWHGLGVKVDGLQTTAAMLTAAGLEWRVATEPLYRTRMMSPDALVKGWVGIVRKDTDALLGVATDRYVPIQNTQAGDMVDALVTEGGAHVEVAGALGEGERCWMLAHIPADFEVVKGDGVRPYFLLAWGHDGKHGLAGKLTTIRVVCNNTLTAAGFGKGARWSESADVYIRHTGDAKLRIAEAHKALGLVRTQVEATSEAYRAMAGATVADPRGYFRAIFPEPDAPAPGGSLEDGEAYEEKLGRWQAHQDRLLELFEVGAGAQLSRGTAWGAYNAVTEWTDHVYPVLQSGELSAVRQRSVLFGSYADVKRRAFTEALALAGAV